jgi:WD40 repeat protein
VGSATSIQHIAFSDDGETLVVGGSQGALSLWNWKDHEQLASLSGHRANITALAFSSGGSRLASGDAAGIVKIWDTNQKQAITTLRVRESGMRTVTAVALTPQGDLVATACFLDTAVRLWDADRGQLRDEITVTDLGANALVVSPDGTTLAIGGGNGIAMLWDIAHRQQLTASRVSSGAIRSMALSADGRVLATGGVDGSVNLWDLSPATGANRKKTSSSNEPLACFSP